MKEYMIVLKGSFNEWNAQTQAQRDEIMSRYNAWAGKLAGEKILRGGSELTSKARRIRNNGSGVNLDLSVDGPFPESKEALTGYFVVLASDIDTAVEIAKGCPALTHGDTVEIYEKPDDCVV